MKPYYETENGKLYHGDCLEVMRELESGSVDLILTDPPYDAKTHNGAILEHEINFKHIDDGDFLKELVSLCLEKSKGWCLCFCSLEMLAKYKELSKEAWIRAGIWDRIVNMPQISGDRPAQGGEGVAIFHRKGRKIWNGGGKAAIWRHSVERGLKEHPTQKPIKLFNEHLQ
jgi:site-specific DNA-methyltransferase (adenine-specific)